MDRIVVKDLRARGICGVLERERHEAQDFALTITMERELTSPAASDALEDTVDYGEVANRAVAAVQRSRYQLLEALAGEIADELLATFPSLDAVEVELDKLHPPIDHPLASTGVVLRRARA